MLYPVGGARGVVCSSCLVWFVFNAISVRNKTEYGLTMFDDQPTQTQIFITNNHSYTYVTM